MTGPRPTSVEQHLGDRLAALVDGELGHDARERVLAHLATCPKCKAEADAQRRLKNVFAQAAPPPPSASFLARLQGLPGCGGDSGERPGGGRPLFDVSSPLPSELSSDNGFAYAPVGPHAPLLPGAGRGFPVHPAGRQGRTGRGGSEGGERSTSYRGLRFAFAAAGAVSLAAIALGGVSSGVPTPGQGEARAGSNAVPARAQAQVAGADAGRRRGAQPAPARRSGQAPLGPLTSVEASAPLLPGIPSPSGLSGQSGADQLTAPLLAGAAALSPLARSLPQARPLIYEPGVTTLSGAVLRPEPRASAPRPPQPPVG